MDGVGRRKHTQGLAHSSWDPGNCATLSDRLACAPNNPKKRHATSRDSIVNRSVKLFRYHLGEGLGKIIFNFCCGWKWRSVTSQVNPVKYPFSSWGHNNKGVLSPDEKIYTYIASSPSLQSTSELLTAMGPSIFGGSEDRNPGTTTEAATEPSLRLTQGAKCMCYFGWMKHIGCCTQSVRYHLDDESDGEIVNKIHVRASWERFG